MIKYNKLYDSKSANKIQRTDCVMTKQIMPHFTSVPWVYM